MNPRRTRLSLEPLDARELPSTAVPTPTAPPTGMTSAISATTTAQGPTRHYPHIRVAMLAYTGTPVGTFEQKLLRESVDLVIPNLTYLNRFDALAPGTPQMIYTNVSNIYLD